MSLRTTAVQGAQAERTPRRTTLLSCHLDSADARPGPPITIVHMVGELDLSTRPVARGALRAGLRTATDPDGPRADRTPGALVIDVAELGFCGATGLTQLTETARAATDAGAGYALAAPDRHLQRLVALLESEYRIDTYPSLAAAVGSLRRASRAPRATCRARTARVAPPAAPRLNPA